MAAADPPPRLWRRLSGASPAPKQAGRQAAGAGSRPGGEEQQQQHKVPLSGMTEGMSPVSSPIKAWSPERPPAFSGSAFNSARALAPLPPPLANPGSTTVHASSSGKQQQQCGAWKSPEPRITSHPQPAHAQQAHRAAAANPLGPPRSPAALAAAAQGVAALQPQRPPPPPPPGLAFPAARRPAGAEGGALGPFSRGGSQADLISFAEAHRDEFSVELLPGGASRLLRSPSGKPGVAEVVLEL